MKGIKVRAKVAGTNAKIDGRVKSTTKPKKITAVGGNDAEINAYYPKKYYERRTEMMKDPNITLKQIYAYDEKQSNALIQMRERKVLLEKSKVERVIRAKKRAAAEIEFKETLKTMNADLKSEKRAIFTKLLKKQQCNEYMKKKQNQKNTTFNLKIEIDDIREKNNILEKTYKDLNITLRELHNK
jgi:hypothetical protein